MGAATLAATAAPAEARVYSYGGSTGSAKTVTGYCKYDRTNVSGSLRIAENPPNVSAINRTTGTDYNWVRYQAFLIDANNANVLQRSGWSGWLRVSDASYSTWSGTTSWAGLDWRGNYTMDFRIEWWDSSQLLGWQAHRIEPYNYYDMYNVGPIGPITTCRKL